MPQGLRKKLSANVNISYSFYCATADKISLWYLSFLLAIDNKSMFEVWLMYLKHYRKNNESIFLTKYQMLEQKSLHKDPVFM